MDVAPLSLGDVEKTSVGGVEEGDTEGHPDAHDPEFDVGRHEMSIGITPLDGHPINVKEHDCAEGQWQATDSQDGHLSSGIQEDHAGDQNGGPDCREGYPPDAHTIHAHALGRRRLISGA